MIFGIDFDGTIVENKWPDGYRSEPRGLIISHEHFISVKGGTLEFVPRHGGKR